MQIETVVVGAFQVNCFVLWREGADSALVIDPGAEPESILSVLNSRGLSVAVYLLTHGHVDHISAIASLCRVAPAPVAIHRGDLEWAFAPQNQMPPFYSNPEEPPNVERVLEEGQEWTDAGITYTVLATPGHTPGSVSFLFPESRSLFSGDTIFAGSVGRTDFPGGDSRTLTRSLARLASLPPETKLYPGHGPATDVAREKKTNFFLQSLP